MSIRRNNGRAAAPVLLCLLALVAVGEAQPPPQPLGAVTQHAEALQEAAFDGDIQDEITGEKLLQGQRLERNIRSAAGGEYDLPNSALKAANPRILPRSLYSHVLKPSVPVSAPSDSRYNVNAADILHGTGWTVLGSTERDLKNGNQNTACPQKCQKWDPIGKVCRLDFACHLRGGSDLVGPDNAQASIIKAGGCPSCHLSDFSGKCRVLLSCMLGLKGN